MRVVCFAAALGRRGARWEEINRGERKRIEKEKEKKKKEKKEQVVFSGMADLLKNNRELNFEN